MDVPSIPLRSLLIISAATNDRCLEPVIVGGGDQGYGMEHGKNKVTLGPVGW